MGKKKGRMSDYSGNYDGSGKWAKNEVLRNLDQHLKIARNGAYDRKGMEKKELQVQSLTRKKKIFPYLNRLVHERVRDDTLRATLPTTTYRSLTKPLSFDKVTSAFTSKFQEYINIHLYRHRDDCGDGNPRSTLFQLCLESVVKNILYYDLDDLSPVLTSMLDTHSAEYFNYLCLKHNKLTNKTISLLGLIPTRCVYLPPGLTFWGLEKLTTTMVTSYEHHRPVEDSWESLDLDNFNLQDGRETVECLCYFQDSINIDLFQAFKIHFPCVQEFHLIQAQLSIQDWYITKAESMKVCLQMLHLLLDTFPAVQLLQLNFCPWINVDAFRDFLSILQPHYQAGTLSLKTIRLYGWYDREYRTEEMMMMEWMDDPFFPMQQETVGTNNTMNHTIQDFNTTSWTASWVSLVKLYEEYVGVEFVLETDVTLSLRNPQSGLVSPGPFVK